MCECFCGERVTDTDERICPEKAVDRNRDFVLTPIIREDEKGQKDCKKEELRDTGGVQFHTTAILLNPVQIVFRESRVFAFSVNCATGHS